MSGRQQVKDVLALDQAQEEPSSKDQTARSAKEASGPPASRSRPRKADATQKKLNFKSHPKPVDEIEPHQRPRVVIKQTEKVEAKQQQEKGKQRTANKTLQQRDVQPKGQQSATKITDKAPTHINPKIEATVVEEKSSENKKPNETGKSKQTQGSNKPRRSQQQKKKDAVQSVDIRSMLPVRKSGRVPVDKLKAQKEEEIKRLLRNKEDPEHLMEVVELDGKGKGVLAAKSIDKGDYVCEYAGELLTKKEAEVREKEYTVEAHKLGLEEMMCYMYFLRHQNQVLCVDATKSKRIGRLINHSRTSPNLKTNLFVVDDTPHLGLVATRAISAGEELLYDYGERDPDTLKAMPWLKE